MLVFDFNLSYKKKSPPFPIVAALLVPVPVPFCQGLIAAIQQRHLFLSPPRAFACHPLDGFGSDEAVSVLHGGPWASGNEGD